MRWVSRSLM